MIHFYDGQIRKFLTQFVRILSNFSIELGKGADGTTSYRQVPVTYGDLTRQVANIIRNNSANALQSAPKIAAYIKNLEYDRERMQNPYYVETQNLRERNLNPTTGEYDTTVGSGYTIHKIMPSPFKLYVTADIYTTNTDMKLQILEQILYLFNPDFEIQKSDNYIDWTSLSYVQLDNISWSSRTIPVGDNIDIDVASINFFMPIWLSPPVQISKLGVIEKIIMSVYNDEGGIADNIIKGDLLTTTYVSPGNFSLLLQGNQLRLLGSTGNNAGTGGDGFYTGAVANSTLDPFQTYGPPINWNVLLSQYGKVTNGLTQIKLMQDTGYEVVGTIATTTLDDTILLFNIDSHTIPSSTLAPVDKIINPLTYNPGTPADGTRYLLIDNIGSEGNTTPAWGNLVAQANDIIQYSVSTGKWTVVWSPATVDSTIPYVTNLNTGIQYRWNGTAWVKSYEGIYIAGKWTLVL